MAAEDEQRWVGRAIYLSPHLDDAVWSCGAIIAQQVRAGRSALVVTICSGQPAEISAYAARLHARSGLAPEQVTSVRLAEDAAALHYLGAGRRWLGFRDAIYRRPDRYHSDERLFGTLGDEDGRLVSRISHIVADLLARWPRAIVYAPLGVGLHVDHQLAYLAARRLEARASILHYEDIPYVRLDGALGRRLASLGVKTASSPSWSRSPRRR